MGRYAFTAGICFTLGLFGVGCGSSDPEPKSAATAEVELTPMEQLQGISTDLDADVASLMKPIDDVQAIIDELTHLPEKYGVTLPDVMGMAKTTFDSGKVEVKADLSVDAAAKAEIELLLKKLNEVCAELKATPDKVAALGKKLVEDTARVPVLATRVTVSTTAIAGNPFSSSADRAKAKADARALARVEKQVNKAINETQQKIVNIPALASNALAKLTASFMGGVSTG